MKQEDLYTIEVLDRVPAAGVVFKIIKNANNMTGKVDYRAIPCDEAGNRINALPIKIAPVLRQITAYIDSLDKKG